jgi:hypothetical protein
MRATHKRASRLTVVVPLIIWALAGVANAGAFIMGNPPSTLGVVCTTVALCAWLGAGWSAGARQDVGFAGFAVFWIAVLFGAPVTSWALSASPGMSVSRGGWVLPMILFALMAPLYGLYALLPAWEPIVQATTVGASTLVLTLVAYFAGRRLGRAGGEGGQDDPEAR